MKHIVGNEVGEIIVLRVPPHMFRWVEFRGAWREPLDFESRAVLRNGIAFDQNGNVWQWTDGDGTPCADHIQRGGSYTSGSPAGVSSSESRFSWSSGYSLFRRRERA
jgi:hypothetical protein